MFFYLIFLMKFSFYFVSGPLKKTIVDFWRLVWQEKTPSIVMITNLEEGGKTKCEQYWPDSGSKSFGPFRVSVTDQQILADYTIRSLYLEVCMYVSRGMHACVCMCLCICVCECMCVLACVCSLMRIITCLHVHQSQIIMYKE